MTDENEIERAAEKYGLRALRLKADADVDGLWALPDDVGSTGLNIQCDDDRALYLVRSNPQNGACLVYAILNEDGTAVTLDDGADQPRIS